MVVGVNTGSGVLARTRTRTRAVTGVRVVVYVWPSARERVPERVVDPELPHDEAQCCVCARRAWRRQRDPVLQNCGGTRKI